MGQKSSVPSSIRVLLGQLKRAGIEDVTATQIERWYKAGLLPPSRRRGLGQGRGTTSRFPPGTLAQVRALRGLLKRHRDLDKVVILLFLDGYHVSERALRHALAQLFADLIDDLDPEGQHRFKEPRQVAKDAAERVLSRRLATKDERYERRVDIERAGDREAAADALRAVVLPIIGGLDPAAFADALDRHGLTAAAQELSAIAPELSSFLTEEATEGRLSADHIREEALPRLGRTEFEQLAAALAGLLEWLELRIGLAIHHRDRFIDDCLQALRSPRWRGLSPASPSDTDKPRERQP